MEGPIPWKYDGRSPGQHFVCDGGGNFIAEVINANAAARIIHFANCHERLLKAAKLLMTMIEDGRLVRDISRDGEESYAARMLVFVMELNEARSAIEIAEHP